MAVTKKIRIGTRASALALIQAETVADLLRRRHSGIECEIVKINTTGDKRRDAIVREIGDAGVFTKEIEAALLNREIDIAVHSMKDLASRLPDGLCIAAVPERLDPRDALVSGRGGDLESLKPGATVGTGSPRRRAQILALRPDLKVLPIRGNIETRLRKVRRGEFDCVPVALAALQRLNLENEASWIFSESVLLPAPGQGALAVEAREDNPDIRNFLKAIIHSDSFIEIEAERALVRELGAGCGTALAALAKITGDTLLLKAEILNVDGKKRCAAFDADNATHPELLGGRVAKMLLKNGADNLLKPQ